PVRARSTKSGEARPPSRCSSARNEQRAGRSDRPSHTGGKNMNRLRTVGLAGALALAALFGAVVAPQFEAEAQIKACPLGDGWVECMRGPVATPEPPTESPAATSTDEQLADLEPVECHINGCTIPIRIVADDGETLKLMVITFE